MFSQLTAFLGLGQGPKTAQVSGGTGAVEEFAAVLARQEAESAPSGREDLPDGGEVPGDSVEDIAHSPEEIEPDDADSAAPDREIVDRDRSARGASDMLRDGDPVIGENAEDPDSDKALLSARPRPGLPGSRPDWVQSGRAEPSLPGMAAGSVEAASLGAKTTRPDSDFVSSTAKTAISGFPETASGAASQGAPARGADLLDRLREPAPPSLKPESRIRSDAQAGDNLRRGAIGVTGERRTSGVPLLNSEKKSETLEGLRRAHGTHQGLTRPPGNSDTYLPVFKVGAQVLVDRTLAKRPQTQLHISGRLGASKAVTQNPNPEPRLLSQSVDPQLLGSTGTTTPEPDMGEARGKVAATANPGHLDAPRKSAALGIPGPNLAEGHRDIPGEKFIRAATVSPLDRHQPTLQSPMTTDAEVRRGSDVVPRKNTSSQPTRPPVAKPGHSVGSNSPVASDVTMLSDRLPRPSSLVMSQGPDSDMQPSPKSSDNFSRGSEATYERSVIPGLNRPRNAGASVSGTIDAAVQTRFFGRPVNPPDGAAQDLDTNGPPIDSGRVKVALTGSEVAAPSRAVAADAPEPRTQTIPAVAAASRAVSAPVTARASDAEQRFIRPGNSVDAATREGVLSAKSSLASYGFASDPSRAASPGATVAAEPAESVAVREARRVTPSTPTETEKHKVREDPLPRERGVEVKIQARTEGAVPGAGPEIAKKLSVQSVISPFLADLDGLDDADSPEAALPVEARTAGIGPSGPQGATPARPESALLRQVADALPRISEGRVEVQLNPEELGRVRFRIVQGEHGLTVHVVADRPETLDLMRRHVDQLSRDFADAGYDDAGFTFGQDRGTDRGPGEDSLSPEQAPERQEPAASPVHDAQPSSAGLDIRI